MHVHVSAIEAAERVEARFEAPHSAFGLDVGERIYLNLGPDLTMAGSPQAMADLADRIHSAVYGALPAAEAAPRDAA